MRVHVVGLGKLGLPVALALESAGHIVSGWDKDEFRRSQIIRRCVPDAEDEPLIGQLLQESRMIFQPLSALEDPSVWPEIVLVCVQTPHEPRMEGATPLIDEPKDFDYSWLRSAIREQVDAITEWGMDPLLVTVSTCLPGTYDREIFGLVEGVRYAYHPLFIAMGSVIDDFRDPEFLLLGWPDNQPGLVGELGEMYSPVLVRGWGDAGGVPLHTMSIVSAELTKMAYNAFIGFKIMLANTVAMVSDGTGADSDDVMRALMSANQRLISPAYLASGMGDGGACHPRDQIALSALAQSLRLEHDPFRAVIDHRQAHARWLARMWWRTARRRRLTPIMLGRAYKPGSRLDTGSHARLVAHYMSAIVGGEVQTTDTPLDHYPVACYFLGTAHHYFLSAALPKGSVVVDPWGLMPESRGVEVLRPGRSEAMAFDLVGGDAHAR